MIHRAALILVLSAHCALGSVAEDAALAAQNLQAAVTALGQADGANDRVRALTETIRAYELGLATLREALRQADQREDELMAEFERKQGSIAQLLGVLSRIEAEPAPMLMIHPTGPLGAVRSGMILADVTPALQSEAETLRLQLRELSDLRQLQAAAGKTLTDGLNAAQKARSDLAQAISDRTDLPRKFIADAETLRGLLQSADTLDSFSAGLALDADADNGFAGAKGRLDFPVLGTLLLKPYEIDARGVAKPGISLATAPAALVASPWAATIRYRGPLLDYGNVIVLEPGGGYLMIIAGLQEVFGELGEVVAKGAALGLMGGGVADAGDLLAPATDGSAARNSQTLYLELRQNVDPVDPMEWFTATANAL